MACILKFPPVQFFLYLALLHSAILATFSEIGIEAHIEQAHAHAKEHDFTRAIEYLVNALEIAPKSTEAYLQIGDLFFNIGKIGEAVESYLIARQLQPNAPGAQDRLNAVTHYNSGLLFLRRGEYEKAKAEYQLTIELCPNQSFPYYQIGHLLSQQRNFSQAVPYYQKSIQLYAENTGAHYQLMKAYFRSNELAKGNGQLIKLRRIRAQKRFRMAEDDLKSGNINQAVKLYNRTLDMDTEYTPAYARLGAIAFQKGELVEARNHLRRAIEIDPDFTTAHYQLGWIYQQSGQFQQAIQSLERVVALQPNSASACNTLAMFYLERDSRLDKALALAKRAVKFKPIPSYWDTLSYSLYKKQKYEEADKAIKKALELQPDHPEYLTRQRAIQQRLLK